MNKRWGYWLFFVALFLAPFYLTEFRLSLLGKFLCFAIVAVGISLIWGYTGILSLGHGVYFGLGAYCMAMYLKLEASRGHLPDFMEWSGVRELPWFWKPFAHPMVAIAAAIALPTLLAALLSYLTFKNRIKGVYFSLLSQAVVVVFVTLFIGKQEWTGGTNGLTNFSTVFGFSLSSPLTQIVLYWLTAAVLALIFVMTRRLTTGRLGKVLIAIRDAENRVRFLGFNPTVYKVFVYSLSAAFAGVAGALFVLQVGLISPEMMGIIPSIEMVLWAAVGGRHSLMGAIMGAIVMNTAKSFLSENYPDLWLLLLGALFVVVVLFVPKGLAGIYESLAAVRIKEKGGMNVKPVLMCRDVVVDFDGFRALQGVDLAVYPHEVRFLIGPNGAGKTTLLDVICGRTRATDGRVLFFSHDITQRPEYEIVQIGIARKFQSPSIFPFLTVWENMELAMRQDRRLRSVLRAKLTGEEKEMMAAQLEKIGLLDERHRLAGSLSHGQKQWLEIGMQLIQRPQLLLLDEPIAGMSAAERERTGEWLHEMAEHCAVIIVEHDMDFVRRYSKQVTVMHEGKVLCEGSMDEVQQNEQVIDVYLGRGEKRVLRLRDVTAGYDGSVVLDHVDMDVPLGRVTAVLGRNGVGKTTLMKTIIGLIRPMSGVIEWEGEDITRWPPERRARAGIGYVPQGREIFSALTVEENILLGLEAQAEKVRPQPTLDEMYALFPILKEMRQRKGGDLSGGQQQQLAIARALAGRPKLLLLDEPMEGIQPSIVALIHDAIMKIAKEKQVGIILVEHNVELAFSCADRFYILDRGAVVAKGDVDGADLNYIQSFLAV